MRLATTRSNGPGARRQRALPRPEATGDPVAPRVGERRLDGDRVGVDADERAGAQQPGGDREDPRSAADVEEPDGAGGGRPRARGRSGGRPGPPAGPPTSSPSSAQRSMPARQRRVVGWSPVPKAIPGSMAITTSPGCRRWRRQVGRMTIRRPIRSTPTWRFQAVGPVGLVDDLRPQLPDLPQPEGLEVAQRPVHLAGRAPGGRRVARREVGPHGGRRRRVDRGAEPFVDEREPGLDAHAARGDAGQDLADRLDGLRVAGDRQLEPGAVAGAPAGGRVGPGAHPRASLIRSKTPPLPAPTFVSPEAAA